MKRTIIKISVLSVFALQPKEVNSFTEKQVLEELLKSKTFLQNQEIQKLQSLEAYESINSLYRAKLNAQAQRFSSSKEAASPSQPALEASSGFSFDVEKKWQAGLQTRLGFENSYSSLKFSPSPIQNHEPLFFIEASASLYRNFLGRVDKALSQHAHLQSEIIEIQRKLNLQQEVSRTRSIYWSLVANNLSIEVSKNLLKNSQQQLSYIQERFRSSVAEASDVQLSQAQVSQRESSLRSLQLKEQGYLRELKKNIPSLSSLQSENTISYPEIDITKMVKTIEECISSIKKHSSTPKENTLYAELFPKLLSLANAKKSSAAQGVGPELSLIARLESNGIDNTFSDAFSESIGRKQNTWSVGLKLQIPLEKSEYRLKYAQKRIAELSQQKQAEELFNMLDATHETALLSLDFLKSSMQELDATTRFLKQRIRSVEQKYKQGRVDLINLVQEQEQLSNAETGLIESRHLFLQEIISYLAVFNKTPCEFNVLNVETN